MIPGFRGTDDRGPHRQAGFTLLELLVTLTILGLALLLFVGYKPPWSHSLRLSGAVAEIAAGLRAARAEAIAGNRSISFAIDLDARRFQVGTGSARPLPAELQLTLLTVTGERGDDHTGGIRFNPDGSSTGGRIGLVDGGRRIVVGVDWLTGRVSVAELR